jgi:GAF domain-containing protein
VDTSAAADAPQGGVWKLSVAALRTIGKLRKRLQIFFGLGGTAAASLFQLSAKATTSPEWTTGLNVASAAVIVTVLIVNLLLLLADADGAEILAAAHETDERCKALLGRIDLLTETSKIKDDGLKWLSVLYSVSLALRDFIGPLVMRGTLDEKTKKERFDEMLDLVLSQKADLFGIGDERFNFAIYLPDPGQETLSCFCCRRRDRADEEAPHRSWPMGHGHVGRAFQDERELIASDVQDATMEAYFRTPDHLARKDDSARYRSLAAVPIMIGGAKPLGVLIATSDVPGRFRPKGVNRRGNGTPARRAKGTPFDVGREAAVLGDLRRGS